MSLRDSAGYAFGLELARFMPLNDDYTIPRNDRIVGGAGPFDFSGATNPAAVPIVIKLDAAAAENLTIDVSGAVSISAVTATEVVAALDTMFLSETLDLDASVDGTTGRVKIETTETSSPPEWIQIYGLAAEIISLGQGFGLKFIKSNTLKSIGDSPTMKESETISTTDSHGLETEIISDAYRKGFTATVVDSAEDWELLALLEGGKLDSVTGEYEVSTSASKKIYFFVEAYYARYTEGSHKEANVSGWVRKLYRNCVGNAGDKTHERGWADGNYSIIGTAYKDETGVVWGDTQLKTYTVEQFAALELEDV